MDKHGTERRILVGKIINAIDKGLSDQEIERISNLLSDRKVELLDILYLVKISREEIKEANA